MNKFVLIENGEAQIFTALNLKAARERVITFMLANDEPDPDGLMTIDECKSVLLDCEGGTWFVVPLKETDEYFTK